MKSDSGCHEIGEARRRELKEMLDRRRNQVLGEVQTRKRDVSAVRAGERHEVRDVIDQSEMEVRRDLDLALLEIRSEVLARIDDALARLGEDRYGCCLECGRDIALARLTALPFATRCVTCEQALEDQRREATGRRRDVRADGWEPELSGFVIPSRSR